MKLSGLLGLVVIACSSTLACGGGSSSSGGAESPSSTSSDSSDWSGDTGPAEPTGPDCSDGTCFACGDGICPKGAYCDQDAQGGPACAWLAECAGEPSCGCTTGVLGASCSCEAGDGPSVSCN